MILSKYFLKNKQLKFHSSSPKSFLFFNTSWNHWRYIQSIVYCCIRTMWLRSLLILVWTTKFGWSTQPSTLQAIASYFITHIFCYRYGQYSIALEMVIVCFVKKIKKKILFYFYLFAKGAWTYSFYMVAFNCSSRVLSFCQKSLYTK